MDREKRDQTNMTMTNRLGSHAHFSYVPFEARFIHTYETQFGLLRDWWIKLEMDDRRTIVGYEMEWIEATRHTHEYIYGSGLWTAKLVVMDMGRSAYLYVFTLF